MDDCCCSICKEPRPENAVSRLDCSHAFHTHCLRGYAESRLEVERESEDERLLPCPICRRPVDRAWELLWETRRLRTRLLVERPPTAAAAHSDFRIRTVARLKGQPGFVVRSDPARLDDFPVFSRSPDPLFDVEVNLEVRVRDKSWVFEAWIEEAEGERRRLGMTYCVLSTTPTDHDSAAEDEDEEKETLDAFSLDSPSFEEKIDMQLRRCRLGAIRRREKILRERIAIYSELLRTRDHLYQAEDILEQAHDLYRQTRDCLELSEKS